MPHNLHHFGGATSPPKYKRMESLRAWLSQFHSCTQLHLHSKVETRKFGSAFFLSSAVKTPEITEALT